MNYRPDIDGLRAISVIAVIIFHTGFSFLSGGFVGVDVFFVISGYLITGLVYKEITSGTFSYLTFYKRRIARLLPALIITLLLVLGFGFLFYDNREFDNLGKELFFSALGAANILFAQGVNYFAQDDSVRPLIHLWSLGVEEQFYLIWPTLLITLTFFKFRYVLISVIILFFASLFLTIFSVADEPIKTYFQPQYRAFELFIGAFTALVMSTNVYKEFTLKHYQKEIISYIAIFLILASMFLLDKTSTFPGYNTLYAIVGAALLIAFSHNTSVSRILALSPFVFIGLISYPLYLYHQPIISYIHFFELISNKYLILASVMIVSILLAWLTYKYIEKPVRKLVHQKNIKTRLQISSLLVSLIGVAVIGIFIAKNNGVGDRFKLLNPFAYEVTQHNTESFFQHFKPGVNISEVIDKNGTNENKAQVLFIGDSVLQQYVYPLTKALNINPNQVDSITRGGCVLLKGVDFVDEFSDTPCNGLREEAYKLKKHYKYIVISQLWEAYDDQILNFDRSIPKPDSLEKWTPFIMATIKHFKPMADNILLLGYHIKVDGIEKLRPTIFLSKNSYISHLSDLKVINKVSMVNSIIYFNQFKSIGINVLHPIDIWLDDQGKFTLHDDKWSFFSDDLHSANASTSFIQNKFRHIKLTKPSKVSALIPPLFSQAQRIPESVSPM